MYDDNAPELDPVTLHGITVEMKRRDPYGHIYLLMDGVELEDLGVFTTIEAAQSAAKIHIQDVQFAIKAMEELATPPVKKAKKVA